MRRLPPAYSLVVFDAVARHGSIKAASDELGRTHGAVSQQMKKLQIYLDFPLVERLGSGLRLTEAGHELHELVSRSLDGLELGIAAMKNRSPENSVRVGISPTLAIKWLMPQMSGFHKANPDINIQLSLTGNEHLSLANHDLILTYDRLAWDHREKEHYEVIGDVSFGLVVASSSDFVINENGGRVGYALLREGLPDSWAEWERRAGISVRHAATRSFPQTAILLEAAAAGQGAAVVEFRLVADEIQSRRLVAPFGFVDVPDGFVALVSPKSLKKRSTRLTLDWLKSISRAEVLDVRR